MRTVLWIVKGVLLFAFIIAACAVSFYAGDWKARPPKGSPGDVESDFRQFLRLSEAAGTYISSHDGELPGDLYVMLIDPNAADDRTASAISAYVAGQIDLDDLSAAMREANARPDSFGALVFRHERVPRYNVDQVPVKLNKDLSKNTRRCIFYLDYKETEENWVFYADGSVARQAYGQSVRDWLVSLRAAGFPRWWNSARIKAEWYRQNKDKLVWDEAERMYVVRKPSATTAESKPGEGI